MSFTNSTPNYGLPQWIGTDKPTYLGDQNTAYSTIDTQLKANADAAAAATSTANTAASTATTASTNATTALNTANSAASEAASATSAAASATSTANNAATDASAALRASAANTIENLAPAYDPTLTYSVGDLVTYIDENNSGKLYKCIVAVGTPEAFNINKWDDVTTSEAYSKSSSVLATYHVTSANTLTWSEIYDNLFSQIPSAFLTNLDTLEMVIKGVSDVYFQICDSKTSTQVVFGAMKAWYWGCEGRLFTLKESESSRRYVVYDNQTSTWTITNESLTVPTTDQYIYIRTM